MIRLLAWFLVLWLAVVLGDHDDLLRYLQPPPIERAGPAPGIALAAIYEGQLP